MQTRSVNRRISKLFGGKGTGCGFGFSLLLALAGALALAGCDKNPASPTSANATTSSIEGYAGGNNALGKTGGGAATTTVIVAEAQADGSLRTVSTSAVEADASGYYKIDVNAKRERNLIVIATQGTATFKAVVASEVSEGTTVKAPPMSDRSTVAANIYERLVATGRASLVTMADIDASLDSDIALDIKNDDSATAQLADAIAARVEAEDEACSSANINLSQDQMNAITQAKVDAATAYDNALYAQSGNSQGSQAAFFAFVDAMAHVYLDHGLDVDGFSRVQFIALRALSQWSAQLSTDARFRIDRNIARVKARIFSQVVLAKFQALGAAQAQTDAVVSASTTLEASVEAALTGSDLTAAFSLYHSAVLQALTVSLSAYANVIASIDTQISGASGFRPQLQASLLAASTSAQVAQAYLTYYSQVKGAVTAGMVGASDVQVNAVAAVLDCTNLYS